MDTAVVHRAVALRCSLEEECANSDKFTTAIETLLRYADNVLAHPEELKYRNVNQKNKNYVDRVGQFPAGRLLMELLGFSRDVEEGRLILRGSIEEGAVNVIRGVCETPAPAQYAAEAAPPPTEEDQAQDSEDEDEVEVVLESAPQPQTAPAAALQAAQELQETQDTETSPSETHSRHRILTPLDTFAEPQAAPEPAALDEVEPAADAEVPAPAAPEAPEARRAVTPEAHHHHHHRRHHHHAAEDEEEIWSCIRCTFHNTVLIIACDMCGTPRDPQPHANAACSPMVTVPEEASRISVMSVGVSAAAEQVDASQGTESLVGTADAACSPFAVAPATAEAACSANIRSVKTPVLDTEAGLEEGLLRVRRRLAQLCNRSASGGSTSSSSVLQDLTNALPASHAPQAACPAVVPRAGSTPLRRDLASTLECGVCLCLIVYPVTTPCGHSFCRHCLVEATAKAGKKCPACRSPCEVDVAKCPENKLLANTARLANPSEYSARSKEAEDHLKRLERAAAVSLLPVLIGDDSPCPGSTCKLQLAEPRDVALLQFIAGNRGAFILLPSSEGSRVRTGAVGLQCTLRRTEDLPNGHATASVFVGHRIRIVRHETASQGHTSAEVETYFDTNEGTYEALAATHHLQRIVQDFFRTQSPDMQRQVERFAGPEPSLVPMPTQHQGRVPLGSTRYTFWVAAVLAHLRILSKRMKPTLVAQKDCVSRATSLAHIIGAVMRQNSTQASNLVTENRTRQAEFERPAGYPARRDYRNRGEIRAA